MRLRDIKANAREALKGHWGVAIIASFIAGTFTASGGAASSSSSSDVDFSQLSEFSSTEIITAFAMLAGFVLLGLVISIIVSSLVSVGYAQFNIDLVEGNDPRIITLFSKGKQIWTTIIANLLIFIRVFIGTILFIIPGIIASYQYAMVNYIIAENPGISAREALAMSKEMMKGNKFRFFCLGLSFIGWSILVILTLGIASIWVGPYIQASCAAFYKDVA
jgi:uncharacterized membrane protein